MHIRAWPVPYARDRRRRRSIGVGRPLAMLLAGVSLVCILIAGGATAMAAGLCQGPHHRDAHRPRTVASRGARDCDPDGARPEPAWWDHARYDAVARCTPYMSRSVAVAPQPAPAAAPAPGRSRGVTTVRLTPPRTSAAPAPVSSSPPAASPSPLPAGRQPPVIAPPSLTLPAQGPIVAPSAVPVSIYVITMSALLVAAAMTVAVLVLVRRSD